MYFYGGCRIPPWFTFKGKVNQYVWIEALIAAGEPDGHITVSENRWTDNELGLRWIKECFDPATRNIRRLQALDS
jgi:hypothetical protein